MDDAFLEDVEALLAGLAEARRAWQAGHVILKGEHDESTRAKGCKTKPRSIERTRGPKGGAGDAARYWPRHAGLTEQERVAERRDRRAGPNGPTPLDVLVF